MKLEVTREVVTDLWPLYRAGEASADSRALVESYLAFDGAFATTLREMETLPVGVPGLRLSPDAERRLLDETRDRARKDLLIKGAAVAAGAIVVLTALVGALFVVGRSL